VLIALAAVLVKTLAPAQTPSEIRPDLLDENGGPRGNAEDSEVPKQTEESLFARVTESAPSCEAELRPEQVRYTLVTQLSYDRLWMMGEHCERWGYGNLISVVVFTNLDQNNVTQQLLQEGCRAQDLQVQTLAMDDYEEEDYPVNVLRNMALSVVQTSHVVYVDVDFWEATNLHDILDLPNVKEEFASNSKLLGIVPAFQINRQCREYKDCREENIRVMPRTRDDAAQLDNAKRLTRFDPTNRAGHGSTKYLDWVNNKDGTQDDGQFLDIPCITSNRYEPYFVVRYCHDLPPFQSQFSGYGKNKMTFIMQLRRMGYMFRQIGGAFVVHYPHLDSPSRQKWNEAPEQLRPVWDSETGHYSVKHPKDIHADWHSYKRGRVDALFVQFRNWLTAEFPNHSSVPLCDNREDDDSKLWIDRSNSKDSSS